MKIREHRGSLVDSMATVTVIEPTAEAIARLASLAMLDYGVAFTADQVKIEWYCYDPRIGWETYIVTLEGYGVFGFTDGPLE